MRGVRAAGGSTIEMGDVRTWASPDIVEEIRVLVQGKDKVATKKGPEDIERFGDDG